MLASPYAIGNSVRAVVASGFTTLLLLYYDRKAEYVRWQAEVQTLRVFYGEALNKTMAWANGLLAKAVGYE